MYAQIRAYKRKILLDNYSYIQKCNRKINKKTIVKMNLLSFAQLGHLPIFLFLSHGSPVMLECEATFAHVAQMHGLLPLLQCIVCLPCSNA